MMRAKSIALTATLLLIVGALAGCQPKPSGPADFVTFDGQPKRIADYTGKPVVVDFWAVW